MPDYLPPGYITSIVQATHGTCVPFPGSHRLWSECIVQFAALHAAEVVPFVDLDPGSNQHFERRIFRNGAI